MSIAQLFTALMPLKTSFQNISKYFQNVFIEIVPRQRKEIQAPLSDFREKNSSDSKSKGQ